MAEAGQQRPLTTAFAPPPPLWKHFNADNVKRLEAIKKEACRGEGGKTHAKKWTPDELRSLELPPELHYLVPPEIPTSGHYSVFGELQSLSTALPSLKEQGIEQLYPSSPAPETDGESSSKPAPAQPLNHAYYLLKISKSLLLNFLEFVGILSITPEQFESKVEDLRNLFINAHHLLNLYRPHQARESLIMMMEEQLDRTREEIREMDRVKVEIEAVMEQLKAEGTDADTALLEHSNKNPTSSTEKPSEESQLVWGLMNEPGSA